MRRLVFVVLALLSFSRAALGQTPPIFPTSAGNGILIDADTGAVLFEKQADTLIAPASLMKLMTLEILFKKLKAGEITLQTEFPVSVYAWKTGGAPSRTSAMFIPLNTTATVGDLIQGIIVQNGNDACIAVAEGLAGTETTFAQQMTDEAKRIGLERATFANSTGLPNPGNLMTVREIAELALYIIREYPEYYPYFAQKDFKYRSHNFINLNPLLNANIGADGLKISFVEDFGYGIVASAVKDGRRLVMVLDGIETESDRKEESIKLLNWGFTNFRAFTVFDKGDTVGAARVWGAENRHVPLKTHSEVKILLPINAKDQRIKVQIVYQGPLKPPVHEGDPVGEVRITADAGPSNTAPLFAAANDQPGGIFAKGIDSLLIGADEIVSHALAKVLKTHT